MPRLHLAVKYTSAAAAIAIAFAAGSAQAQHAPDPGHDSTTTPHPIIGWTKPPASTADFASFSQTAAFSTSAGTANTANSANFATTATFASSAGSVGGLTPQQIVDQAAQANPNGYQGGLFFPNCHAIPGTLFYFPGGLAFTSPVTTAEMPAGYYTITSVPDCPVGGEGGNDGGSGGSGGS